MRRHRAAVLAGIVVSTLAVPVGIAPAPAAAVPVTAVPVTVAAEARPVWDRCRPAVPDTGRCGHLVVPVDPARPALGNQRVGFELYRRSDRSRPSLGTIVANEGGPGYPSTGSRDYYLRLFRPLLDRHDLLLVDQRGTGTSQPLDCRDLQRGSSRYVRATTACGEQLGERADTYATAFAANDLALVLDALRIDTVDLYGDSYGTFFAQVFALHHPDRLRTLVLDASYPVSGNDPWWRDTNRAIVDALRLVCQRSADCARLPGDPVDRMRALADRLERSPVRGRAPDGEGERTRVTLDGRTLALVTAYATYGTNIYRELDSAVRAFDDGDRAPLLRLVAENVPPRGDNGPSRDFSAGQYAAVICNDYPQLWDVSLAPGAQRQEQYRAALADLRATDPGAFAPFGIDAWIASAWTEPRTCIGWPSPSANALPPSPPAVVYPDVPTLVLAGDLDSVTSSEGGRVAASRFPAATFVQVANAAHVSAMGDRQGCAAGIVRRFVRSGGTVSGTSCAATAYPNVRVVPRFAGTTAGLTPADQGARTRTSARDRRVVAAASLAAGDVLTRWFVNYSGSGVGLRGGEFSYSGDQVVTFRLTDLRFTRDTGVSGRVTWNRSTGRVDARLRVDGPGRRDGVLAMRWDDWQQQARARITGRLHGAPVDLVTGAP